MKYILEHKIQNSKSTKVSVASNDRFYVYKVTLHSSDGCPDSTHYECFKRMEKTVNGFKLNSDKYKGYDTYEPYPNDEDFGKWAWCFMGLQSCVNHLKRLN